MVHVVVVMMMVVMVMMVMMHLMRHRSGGSGRRRGVLCDGVSGEAEREHGGGGEGLDHGNVFLWFRGTPMGQPTNRPRSLNSI